MVGEEYVIEAAFAFLTRKYVQTADGRQRAMGLQYMHAETHDLAIEFSRFFMRYMEDTSQ